MIHAYVDVWCACVYVRVRTCVYLCAPIFRQRQQQPSFCQKKWVTLSNSSLAELPERYPNSAVAAAAASAATTITITITTTTTTYSLTHTPLVILILLLLEDALQEPYALYMNPGTKPGGFIRGIYYKTMSIL